MRNRVLILTFLAFASVSNLTMRAAKSAASTTILQTAKKCTGKTMWKGYGLSSGKLGCAAAVSNVLNAAGYKQAKSAGVRVLYTQLRTTRGAKEFSLPGTGKSTTASILAAATKPGTISE